MKAPSLRRPFIEEESRAILEHLEGSGLTPVEGLTAVEAVYSLLLIRGMDAAGPDRALANVAKELALRSLARMQSRVISWPARTADRQ